MRVAYIRVSTQEQNEARQLEALKHYGIEKPYQDKVSGKDTARPEFQKMMNFVREGNGVQVTEWSRLPRSTIDLLDTVNTLRDRGGEVKAVSLKEYFDTSTPQEKFVLTVFAALAEFERTSILERQKEGIDIAKKEGRYKGRKEKVLENFDEVYEAWQKKEITAVKAAELFGVTRATFYNRVKKYIKNHKKYCIFCIFEYTKCNRVARSLLDIGDQAETCVQLFYIMERFYGFEKNY